MIVLTSTNYKIKLEGYIEDESGKIGREVTTSTNGVRKESYLRYVDECILIINRCTQANYNDLKDMFKSDNLFEVKDTSREMEYGDMFFDLDSIKLTPTENKKDKIFTYSGNLKASRL